MGINLAKEVKAWDNNCQTLMEEIEEDTNKQKDTVFMDQKN